LDGGAGGQDSGAEVSEGGDCADIKLIR